MKVETIYCKNKVYKYIYNIVLCIKLINLEVGMLWTKPVLVGLMHLLAVNLCYSFNLLFKCNSPF